MIVFADNVYFRRSRTLQLLLVFVIRITEDFNVGFFKLPNKFYVFVDACDGFHHGYIKAMFKTDQSTINIEHSF